MIALQKCFLFYLKHSFHSQDIQSFAELNIICIFQLLFLLKDKVMHLSCVIYKGICSCGETHVGETIRNCKINWNEHEEKLSRKIEHEFSWYVLTKASRVPPKEKFW